MPVLWPPSHGAVTVDGWTHLRGTKALFGRAVRLPQKAKIFPVLRGSGHPHSDEYLIFLLTRNMFNLLSL